MYKLFLFISFFFNSSLAIKKKKQFFPKEALVASYMLANDKKKEIVLNNIANQSISGFKNINSCIESYKQPPNKQEFTHPINGLRWADLDNGSFLNTQNPLNIGIVNFGFFQLSNNALTRNGNLAIRNDGVLINSIYKLPIQSIDDGEIQIPTGTTTNTIMIDKLGNISIRNQTIAKIKVVKFLDKNELQVLPNGLIFTSQLEEVEQPGIIQGYLESSNVDMMKNVNEFRETITSETLALNILNVDRSDEEKLVSTLFG